MPRTKNAKGLSKKKDNNVENIQIEIQDTSSAPASEPKKRGRKPKGGKLITKDAGQKLSAPVPTNVILHLKCSLKEIEDDFILNKNNLIGDPMNYNASIPPTVQAYDNANNDNKFFELDNSIGEHPFNAYNSKTVDANTCANTCAKCMSAPTQTDTNVNIKDINMKLKQLKISLYKNAMDEKKSACFWCTYDYDNQSCYIPKCENDGEIQGYGSFCRPECAVAYLMRENIDDSTKFERYHLLNRIYNKIYDFKNNIKPAPNPHYLLDKFYGNLNIQEYRKLLNSERMLMVVESPLTRILPELHEDTDDFTTGIYGGSKGSATQAGGVYKVKRQSENKQSVSKASIMKERFGVSTATTSS
jgi:hypothetical protein